jgi:hypothetical protein
MSNPDALLKRAQALLKKTGQQRRPLPGAAIVIYDLLTRKPLPGYEPRAGGVVVWLPDNGRDNYAGRISA